MEKLVNKARDIRFFSAKNDAMVMVHSMLAKRFADMLERDNDIKTYKTNVLLERWTETVSTVGVRTSYLTTDWTTDFLLTKQDDTVAVREIVTDDDIKKRAEIEKLEISRRYWKTAHVTDWGIVLVKREERAW